MNGNRKRLVLDGDCTSKHGGRVSKKANELIWPGNRSTTYPQPQRPTRSTWRSAHTTQPRPIVSANDSRGYLGTRGQEGKGEQRTICLTTSAGDSMSMRRLWIFISSYKDGMGTGQHEWWAGVSESGRNRARSGQGETHVVPGLGSLTARLQA